MSHGSRIKWVICKFRRCDSTHVYHRGDSLRFTANVDKAMSFDTAPEAFEYARALPNSDDLRIVWRGKGLSPIQALRGSNHVAAH